MKGRDRWSPRQESEGETNRMPSDLDPLVGLRRHLHRHPELRLSEVGTGVRIEEELRRLGLEVSTVAGVGRIATMEFGSEGPQVLIRADMDAYPIDDAKVVEYASRYAGVTHACGHDVHMCVAIGVAQRLRHSPPGQGVVTFVFQPAEEIPYGEVSGARLVLDSGVLAPSYQARALQFGACVRRSQTKALHRARHAQSAQSLRDGETGR